MAGTTRGADKGAKPTGEISGRDKGAISKVRLIHESVIDFIIANPQARPADISTEFKFHVGWVRRLLNTDAFRAQLAARKEVLVDPLIAASFEEKLKHLADSSLTIIQESLDMKPDPALAMEALSISAKALGYGARAQAPTQMNFVVALPEKAPDSQSWQNQFIPKAEVVNG